MAAIPQNLGVPTGTVMWSAVSEPPVGWLVCDGRSVVSEDYPALYTSIGNTYGGDQFSFVLPNLVGRFILGAGDPGREPFTYEDGVNKAHFHKMNATIPHTHGVTDPEHEHSTSSGSHTHPTTSNHAHANTTNHFHATAWGGPSSQNFKGFITLDYAFAPGDCRFQTYAPNDNTVYQHCERVPREDFFYTVYLAVDDPTFTNSTGKTGITQVNTNITGTTVDIAFTGVTLVSQTTNITLVPASPNIVAGEFGAVGGPQPKNIAFLPIIRT
jgi:microcystin-dependent protein